MLVVTLTSIPPRFGQLPQVIRSLLEQIDRPDRIILCLPETYRRFPGAHAVPALPEDLELLRIPNDIGPAAKVLPAARRLSGLPCDLVYCDDDWLYAPGWTKALRAARPAPDQAVAASGYDVARIGRRGSAAPGQADIAQGFAGVLVRPDMFAEDALDVPHQAWPVDDIWLSGQFARQGIPIALAPEARAACVPLSSPAPLQGERIAGLTRDQANRAAAELVCEKYGVWPPL